MDIKHNFLQVNDTIPTKKSEIKIISNPDINANLSVKKNTIEIVSLRSFSVDSVRVTKHRKPRPVIKTIPFVPVNDSIEHPSFNVLNNNFLFPNEHTFFDGLNFTPYNPLLKNEVFLLKPSKHNINKEKNSSIAQTTQLSQPLLSKKSNGGAVGFLSTDWMLGIIIMSLILFGWIRVGFSRYFRTAIQASYNYFTARRIFDEANITRSRVFYFMNLLFFINTALFITQFLDYNHFTIYKLSGILLFLTIFASIIILYTVKAIFLYLFDFVFLTHKGFASYNFTVFLYNKMAGFLLLPIISILPFVPQHVVLWLFFSGVLIIIMLYFLRILRGLQIGFKNRLSIFYLILYLCALEIMPVLILFKVIYSHI